MSSVGHDKVGLAGLDAVFSYDQVKLWLRLSYAQTYASCQGAEFDGALRLWDVTHRFYTKRHLFVG